MLGPISREEEEASSSPHRESFFVELEDFENETGAAGTVLHATETTGCRVSKCTMIKVAPAAGATLIGPKALL